MKRGTLITLGIILLIVVYSGCTIKNTQNKLVTLDENVVAKWGQVEVQYQRRNDLIGNLVATVKGAADFEKSTLTQVIEARAKATSMKVDASNLTPEKLQEFQAAQGQLSQALGRLMVVSERYPELRATESFRDLSVSIEGTENRIAKSRKDFNESVQGYNTYMRKFPTSMIAGMLNFETKGMFKADAGAEKAPKVEF